MRERKKLAPQKSSLAKKIAKALAIIGGLAGLGAGAYAGYKHVQGKRDRNNTMALIQHQIDSFQEHYPHIPTPPPPEDWGEMNERRVRSPQENRRYHEQKKSEKLAGNMNKIIRSASKRPKPIKTEREPPSARTRGKLSKTRAGTPFQVAEGRRRRLRGRGKVMDKIKHYGKKVLKYGVPIGALIGNAVYQAHKKRAENQALYDAEMSGYGRRGKKKYVRL